MKNTGGKVLSVLIVLLIGVGIAAIFIFLEWEKPQITADKGVAVIGQHKVMEIRFSDRKSGLRHIAVQLSQGRKSYTLAALDLPAKGLAQKTVRIEVTPRTLGLRDGEAVLKATATDFSPLKNSTTLEMKAVIDAVPPRIALLSTAHNVNPGGTCLAIFKVSKPVAACGVRSGGFTAAAYPVTLKGKPCLVSYFAVPIDVQSSTPMAVFAQDRGGNSASVGIPFYIRPAHTFRADTVSLGPSFLQDKASEFQQHDQRLAGKTPAEIFAFINTVTRQENNATIQSIGAKSQARQYWQGTFLRMQNAAPMAKFGDRRTYTVDGQSLGESVHLGVDLASTKHAPIEAANGGVIVYADYLGIYGNTVIIDHGMGIMSLYGHMNDIKVKDGQQVAKGDVIGSTGATGLAGGDHLHFSILVGGQFVNPIEWWDPHWMTDNVENKLSEAAGVL